MENRKDKRFLERDNMRIKDAGQATKTSPKRGINAHTHDISVTGARISSSQDFPVGYVIRIVIDFGGADPALEVDGEVVWTRKSEDGTRFDIGVDSSIAFPIRSSCSSNISTARTSASLRWYPKPRPRPKSASPRRSAALELTDSLFSFTVEYLLPGCGIVAGDLP